MKRILLTGGSGTVGKCLLPMIVDRGYEVFCIDRDTKYNRNYYNKFSNVEMLWGDISEVVSCNTSKPNFDVIIHLAAVIPPFSEGKPELVNKVNVLGTKLLLSCLKLHSPNAFFLYCSSIAVYGDRLNNPNIKVSDPIPNQPWDTYAESKIMAEKEVKESGLAYSIFRTTAIMGANNHKMGPIMFNMPLNTCLEIVTPIDVAGAFFNAIERKSELEGRIFNLGGGEPCRTLYGDLLKKVFKISGLGNLDFPDKAFAEKNFHCGYLEDGDELERILKFRSQSLGDYLSAFEDSIPKLYVLLARLFRGAVKYFMLKMSQPYSAFKGNNKEQIKHFFN